MQDDGKGDWRIATVTTLARDLPAAFPGGPSHKAGALVYQSNLAKHGQYGYLGFVSPHASALALSVALGASRQATSLRDSIPLAEALTPHGSGKTVTNEGIPTLYDFFEQSMISVVFSYLAIETYANSVISLHHEKSVSLNRRGRATKIKAIAAERRLSTVEKVTIALPQLLRRPSPEGSEIWQSFLDLQRARNATVHLKSIDMFTRNTIDKDSLYFEFLNNETIRFPTAAHAIITWFFEASQEPRWSILFRELI